MIFGHTSYLLVIDFLHTLPSSFQLNFEFNTNSLGYAYLIDCIKLCLKNDSSIYNLEKNVYPEVSKLYHIQNFSNIKWSIEKCIKSMSRYTKTEILNDYFPNIKKISPKIFIKKIVDLLLYLK